MSIFDKLIDIGNEIVDTVKFHLSSEVVDSGNTQDHGTNYCAEVGRGTRDVYYGNTGGSGQTSTDKKPKKDPVDKLIEDHNLDSSPYHGYKLVDIDGYWYIATGGGYWNGGTSIFNKMKGSWQNLEHLTELGDLHNCSYQTINLAMADLNILVFDGTDAFTVNEVITF